MGDDSFTLRQLLDEAHAGAELLAVSRVMVRIMRKRAQAPKTEPVETPKPKR